MFPLFLWGGVLLQPVSANAAVITVIQSKTISHTHGDSSSACYTSGTHYHDTSCYDYHHHDSGCGRSTHYHNSSCGQVTHGSGSSETDDSNMRQCSVEGHGLEPYTVYYCTCGARFSGSHCEANHAIQNHWSSVGGYGTTTYTCGYSNGETYYTCGYYEGQRITTCGYPYNGYSYNYISCSKTKCGTVKLIKIKD